MEELNGFGALQVAALAVLAAGAGLVRSIWVAMLGGEDEEQVGAVKVLAVLDGAEPIGIAVSEKVL